MTVLVTFSGPLDTRYDPHASEVLGLDHWRVLRQMGFTGHLPRLGRVGATIPAGYLTDGASGPRLLWGAIPRWGVYGQAVVVHDLLCEYLQVLDASGALVSITRAEADYLFMQAMTALNVPLIRKNVMYAGVSTYRVLSFTTKPSNTPLKRSLEAAWRDDMQTAA